MVSGRERTINVFDGGGGVGWKILRFNGEAVNTEINCM